MRWQPILVLLWFSFILIVVAQDKVKYSVKRGFYYNPFNLTLNFTSFGAGSTIRYTLTKDLPTPTTGTIYTGPILISVSTVVRAMAISSNGLNKTVVSTNTYIFPKDILTKPYIGQTYVTQYGVDTMVKAMTSLPVLSIVNPVNPVAADNTDEVPASVEWWNTDNSGDWQIDCGTKWYGNVALYYVKKNWRFYFRSEYGEGKLKVPIYDGEDIVGTIPGADEYDQLQLHSGSADSMMWMSPTNSYTPPPLAGQYLRNFFGDSLLLKMGYPAPHGRFVHVFQNGDYLGQYHLRERFSAPFFAAYLGGEREEYEYINRGKILDGTGDAWRYIVANSGSYMAVKDWVDVQCLCDYMLASHWNGNFDWGIQWNWQAGGPNSPGRGGIKFFGNDIDLSLLKLETNTIGHPGPDGIFRNLLSQRHPDFEMILYDRAHRLFNNDGVLSPQKAAEWYSVLVSKTNMSIIMEAARWGPLHNGWDKNTSWLPQVNHLMNVYFPNRTNLVLGWLKNSRYASTFQAPVFEPLLGGKVDASNPLVGIKNPTGGRFYYTVDGSDPRLPGGGINPSAYTATSEVGIQITRTTMIKARNYDPTLNPKWSPLEYRTFSLDGVCDLCGKVIVSEFMYYNRDNSSEYIEIQNIGSDIVCLDGSYMTGVVINFTDLHIKPGERIVIAKDPRYFNRTYSRYPTVQYYKTLSNSGERISFVDTQGMTFLSIKYSSKFPWPELPGIGTGYSLVIGASFDPAKFTGTNIVDDAWATYYVASASIDGSPFVEDPNSKITKTFPFVINEVLCRPKPDQRRFIELLNPSNVSYDLKGWVLTRSLTKADFKVPKGSASSNSLFFWYEEDMAGFFFSEIRFYFYMFSAVNGYTDGFFTKIYVEPTEYGYSSGYYTTSTKKTVFIPLATPTPGIINTDPKIGPFVLEEVSYYMPTGSTEYEYIKLKKIEPVDELWNLTGGVISYYGIDISSLSVGDSIYVTKTSDKDTFLSVHGLPQTSKVVSFFVGSLTRDALPDGSIALARPSTTSNGTIISIYQETIDFVDFTNLFVFSDITRARILVRNLTHPLLSFDPLGWKIEKRELVISVAPTPTVTNIYFVKFPVLVFSEQSPSATLDDIRFTVSDWLGIDTAFVSISWKIFSQEPRIYNVTVSFLNNGPGGATLPISKPTLVSNLENILSDPDFQSSLYDLEVDILVPEIPKPTRMLFYIFLMIIVSIQQLLTIF
eukprot:TRINITY_DN285_c0_g1_i1.p1 TRINITY_DN285_c0_g1~~TRINITY_DN285_c0_g1_i1.p1  ORF type:complete len:1214 (+),score=239.97 TRINITY_DN285_c0_g1_i1:445-4086(+)